MAFNGSHRSRYSPQNDGDARAIPVPPPPYSSQAYSPTSPRQQPFSRSTPYLENSRNHPYSPDQNHGSRDTTIRPPYQGSFRGGTYAAGTPNGDLNRHRPQLSRETPRARDPWPTHGSQGPDRFRPQTINGEWSLNISSPSHTLVPFPIPSMDVSSHFQQHRHYP